MLKTKNPLPNPEEASNALGNSWSADMLASRLYSENGSKSGLGLGLGSRTTLLNQAKGATTLRPKNLLSSSSTPSLKNNDKKPHNNKPYNNNKAMSLSSGKSLTISRSPNKKFDLSMSLDEEESATNASKDFRPLVATLQNAEEAAVEHPPIPKTFLESLHLSEKEMDDLLNVPNTFYYLCPKKKSDTKFYDLEMVPQEKLDQSHYYTISKEGITQYRSKQSQFTTRTQWEREFKLFHKISNVRFFRQYRCWKVN